MGIKYFCDSCGSENKKSEMANIKISIGEGSIITNKTIGDPNLYEGILIQCDEIIICQKCIVCFCIKDIYGFTTFLKKLLNPNRKPEIK